MYKRVLKVELGGGIRLQTFDRQGTKDGAKHDSGWQVPIDVMTITMIELKGLICL